MTPPQDQITLAQHDRVLEATFRRPPRLLIWALTCVAIAGLCIVLGLVFHEALEEVGRQATTRRGRGAAAIPYLAAFVLTLGALTLFFRYLGGEYTFVFRPTGRPLRQFMPFGFRQCTPDQLAGLVESFRLGHPAGFGPLPSTQMRLAGSIWIEPAARVAIVAMSLKGKQGHVERPPLVLLEGAAVDLLERTGARRLHTGKLPAAVLHAPAPAPGRLLTP